MRVSGNYPYFLNTERSYFQNRLAFAYVLFHYSLGTQSAIPLSFSLPFFLSFHTEGTREHRAACPCGAPPQGLAWSMAGDCICLQMVRVHFIAGQSLPWPHLRL